MLSPSGSKSLCHISEDSNMHCRRCQSPISGVRTFSSYLSALFSADGWLSWLAGRQARGRHVPTECSSFLSVNGRVELFWEITVNVFLDPL
jgi:hypothetical protein